VEHDQRLAPARLGDMKTDAIRFEVSVADARNLGKCG
jgi:hypothetical protein